MASGLIHPLITASGDCRATDAKGRWLGNLGSACRLNQPRPRSLIRSTPTCSVNAISDFPPAFRHNCFCPSIAPGTGTPSHGGFLYRDVSEILQVVARSHQVVGIDLVEVAPDHDLDGTTAILAAQVLLSFLGFIFHARSLAR